MVLAHRTPLQVQRFLRSLPYNRETCGPTLRTFRGVVCAGEAHCLEAVLTAATILEQHGNPPLVLDLESQDNLDHVLLLYRRGRRWGSVARSRDAGLHGRRPVFRSVRDLVLSYVDPYVDGSGRIVGYGTAQLDELTRADWRLGEVNVWSVERALYRIPHRRLVTSDRRYERALRRYRIFREAHPHAPAAYYRGRESWL
ncbi:MAG: hypothetical protein H0V09_08810 [Gemmatimonadetes bacterium]|nr:hypothetical protein [Gemmatimonadota bacterium]